MKTEQQIEWAETVRGAKVGQKLWLYDHWDPRNKWTLVTVRSVGRKYITTDDQYLREFNKYRTNSERSDMLRFEALLKELRCMGASYYICIEVRFSPSNLAKLEATLAIWSAKNE